MKDAKSIQMLASVSLIGGPLSIIVGGVALSTAALVCGIIALVMVQRSKRDNPENQTNVIMQTLTRQAIIGIAVSAIAFAMNAAALAVMMPAIMDAVQTGDYSSLFGDASSAADSSSGSTDSGGAFGGDTNDSTTTDLKSGRSSVWG